MITIERFPPENMTNRDRNPLWSGRDIDKFHAMVSLARKMKLSNQLVVSVQHSSVHSWIFVWHNELSEAVQYEPMEAEGVQ